MEETTKSLLEETLAILDDVCCQTEGELKQQIYGVWSSLDHVVERFIVQTK